MKTLFMVTLALAVILSMTALAQYSSKEPAQKDQAAQALLKSIDGTVKVDGDKITFVADKDQKSWAVENPEALKGHEGHRVQVKSPCRRRQGIHSHHGSQDAERRRNEKRGDEKVRFIGPVSQAGRRQAALFLQYRSSSVFSRLRFGSFEFFGRLPFPTHPPAPYMRFIKGTN